ncbi:MAG: hypothetical protein BYD32DRAFT_112510 [Podila humilis]|nr:MAG: hypothetical protein BYD32DRAFT_112510 [Podila humilis]
MSSVPKSIRSNPDSHGSQDLSSSPHRDATTRLLSSSPSVAPQFFGRPASRNSNNNSANEGTPSSSWRSPSTLQNYRSNDAGSSNEVNNPPFFRRNSNGLDSSGNSIHGSFTGVHSDSIPSIVDIPADEASKVVKKHLVLNSTRDSMDSDRNGHGGSGSGGHDGTGDEVVDYTTAFKLPGGAITRDVYKWQADQENEQNRRGKHNRELFWDLSARPQELEAMTQLVLLAYERSHLDPIWTDKAEIHALTLRSTRNGPSSFNEQTHARTHTSTQTHTHTPGDSNILGRSQDGPVGN